MVSDDQLVPRRNRTTGSPDRAADEAAITPELALVTPALASAARADLPDRPWEAHSGCVPPGFEEGLYRPQHDRLATRNPHDLASGRKRGAMILRISLLASLAAMSLLLASVTHRNASSVEPLPLRTAPVTTAVDERPGTALLISHGGYVVAPSGSLRVDATGREIERFSLPVRCGASTPVLEGIPVATRSFEFVGTARPEGVTIRIRGRVVSPELIRGVATHEGPRCSPQRAAFTARLS